VARRDRLPSGDSRPPASGRAEPHGCSSAFLCDGSRSASTPSVVPLAPRPAAQQESVEQCDHQQQLLASLPPPHHRALAAQLALGVAPPALLDLPPARVRYHDCAGIAALRMTSLVSRYYGSRPPLERATTSHNAGVACAGPLIGTHAYRHVCTGGASLRPMCCICWRRYRQRSRLVPGRCLSASDIGSN
jgi:hypothetical protein